MSSTGVRNSDLPAVGDDETPFELAWVSRTIGGAERRQVVVLAVCFAVPTAADEEETAAAVVSRHQCVTSIVGPLGGEIVRVATEFHLVAWGHRSACLDDGRLAAAAAFELAGEDARCGLDIGIATTIDPTFAIPGVPFVSCAIDGALMQLAKACNGMVVATSDVRRILGDSVVSRPIDGTELSWAVAQRSGAERLALVERRSHPALERSEMRTLAALWQAARAGQTGLAVITGAGWSGKSVLARELCSEIAAAGGRLIYVECRPEDRQRTLMPLRDIAASLDELSGVDANAIEAIRALNAALDNHLDFKAIGSENAVGIARLLAAAFTLVSANRPIGVVLEQVEWADASTLACLRAFPLLVGEREKVLVVATARDASELPQSVEPGSGWQHIHLRPWQASSIERALLQDSECSALHHDAIVRVANTAEGNVGLALEIGSIALAIGGPDAHYRILARPNKLNPLLTARLDALGILKPLVQAAALLGNVFDGRILALLLQIRLPSIIHFLDALVARGVLVRRSGCAHEYRFCGNLMWSQAYGSVVRSRRRELHRQIARMLEGKVAAALDVAPEVVAYHWKKARDGQRAFAWWFNAARAAAERGAPDVAVTYANEALAAKQQAPGACSADEEASLMSLLGSQLRASQGSSSDSTVAAYERARQILAALPSRPRDIDLDISWGLATIHLVRGDIRAAVEASGRLLIEARERNLDDVVLVALRLHGTARLMSGDVPAALAHFEAAIEAADRQRGGTAIRRFVSDPGAVALAHLASAQALAGLTDESKLSRAKALTRIGKIAHPHTTSNVLGVLALAAMHLDDTAMAAALSKASLAVSAVHGHRYWEARARLIIAFEKTTTSGNPDPFDLIRQIERYRESGSGRARVFSTCLAADAALRSGHPRNALDLLHAALLQASAQGERLYLPEVMRLETQAKLALRLIGKIEAIASLRAAEELAAGAGAVVFARRCSDARATIARGSDGAGKVLKRAPSPAARQIP